MNQSLKTAAVLTAVLMAAGCSRSVPTFGNSGPAPLAPVPSGQVASNQLPPPPPPPPPAPGSTGDQMASGGSDMNGGNPGDNASGGGNGGGNTQVASLGNAGNGNAGAGGGAGGGGTLSRNSVLGAYKVTTTGGNCQIILSLTKWTGGYRAASRGCPGTVADVSAWDVSGNQVLLKDSGGANVASLNSAGGSRFEGRTTSGQQISLYR